MEGLAENELAASKERKPQSVLSFIQWVVWHCRRRHRNTRSWQQHSTASSVPL